MTMDKSQTKALLTQALIQIGIVAALALGSFAFSGCARKDTTPPGAQGSLSAEQVELLNRAKAVTDAAAAQQSADAEADTNKTPNATAKSVKNGDKLLALILKDKAMTAYRAQYEKKNNAVCTRPSAGQMHWDCKSSTECNFSLEFTCVSNVGQFKDNNEIRRLSLLGEGNSAKMTYKISNPAQTAAESKVHRLKFEYKE